jgi:hypothetical protein
MTRHLAARLQALAEPDVVVIAAGTRQLVDLPSCSTVVILVLFVKVSRNAIPRMASLPPSGARLG